MRNGNWSDEIYTGNLPYTLIKPIFKLTFKAKNHFEMLGLTFRKITFSLNYRRELEGISNPES